MLSDEMVEFVLLLQRLLKGNGALFVMSDADQNEHHGQSYKNQHNGQWHRDFQRGISISKAHTVTGSVNK